MAFTGFPEQGLAFLRELARNNDRDWFEAHRAAWDEGIVPAMMAWCGELGIIYMCTPFSYRAAVELVEDPPR